ncbi:hypothetical protein CHS0354_028280 [Potamilus streckersoni]|uniref:Uncharacterized protein n=1 Tax=Potamilus streckersoni TaxID=2493646 RepID=A0AAE0RTU5_9BIVA|nr:hypothetical protein CHS0354_028280 [Potamilus streckersoni]
MGACYSKTGHGTDMSSNDHLPYAKVTSNNHQRNGHAKKDGYESVQTSEDYENRTPQTCIGVDANKNLNPNSKDLIQDNSGVPEDAETCKMDYMDAVPIENTVTQSDSGIVVEPILCSTDDAIGLKNEQNTACIKYQHWYNGKDSTNQQEPLKEQLETGRVLNLPLNLHSQSSTSGYIQTCSTFTPTPDSDLDDVYGEFPRLLKHNPNRKSETFILKSSLKKDNNKGRKNHRLSWKSADSLDIAASMMTCMDRTKSEASDLFGDELSINAPLATFDSVDFAIGSSYDFSQKLRNCYVEYYSSDTFEFKFDFSGLEGGSRTAKSDSSGKDSRGETTANIDKILQAIHRSTLPSPAEYSRSITEPIGIGDRPSSSLSTLGSGEVATMTIDGREVVLIDAEVYAQILEEIAFLKLKLSQLTQVIQEDEEESQNRTTENLEILAESVSCS